VEESLDFGTLTEPVETTLDFGLITTWLFAGIC
jgi:hypothetical protein